jgi:hypothetical protein
VHAIANGLVLFAIVYGLIGVLLLLFRYIKNKVRVTSNGYKYQPRTDSVLLSGRTAVPLDAHHRGGTRTLHQCHANVRAHVIARIQFLPLSF